MIVCGSTVRSAWGSRRSRPTSYRPCRGPVVADPEDIGSAGRSTLRGPPREHRDCQPYPPWATTTVCFINSLHAYTKGVIVPMTVLARDLATSTTLRGCAAVRHLVLHATVQVLKDRIGHDHPPGEEPVHGKAIRAHRSRHLGDYHRAAAHWLHGRQSRHHQLNSPANRPSPPHSTTSTPQPAPLKEIHAVDGKTWDTIDQLARRFNEHDTALGLGQEEQWSLQVLKIAEETGEASQAVIGARGTNPRKGAASWDEAHAEVADVVITALVALARMRPDDAAEYLARQLAAKSAKFLSPSSAAIPAPAEPA